MRLTTGVAGDGDPIGLTLRAAGMVGGKGHGSRKTGVSVHVVPLESWWAGTWETLCSRMVVEFVGWHDPDVPDPRLCSVCARRVARLRADRLEAVA